MNKLFHMIGMIIWYILVGVICFMIGWLLRAIKAKKA